MHPMRPHRPHVHIAPGLPWDLSIYWSINIMRPHGARCAWLGVGCIWRVLGSHGTPQPPMRVLGPSLYGVSWGVLWHVMGRAMGVACVHSSHSHFKCPKLH